MEMMSVLAGLFFTAFAAATILPMQSEALLAGLLLTTSYPVGLLVATASIGNILGATVNWGLGRKAEQYKDKRWFPVKAEALVRAQDRYRRYGRWSLLLSWVPFIGDPLTVAAGLMREKLVVFLLLVSLAKTGRYIVMALLVLR